MRGEGKNQNLKGVTPYPLPLTMFGLYIHLPFCQKKCAYCSFNSIVYNPDLARKYLAALELEIRRYEQPLPPLTSIYFGGGTPSIFSPPEIETILSQCLKRFTLAGQPEISLEANPNTVNLENLKAYRKLGINRLSLGAQSLDSTHLATLGRLHTAGQVRIAAEQARQAGFDNLSLDMIFGIPGQTAAGFRRELEQLIGLSPQHISLYNLTLEEGTVLYEQVRQGKLPRPQEETEARMYRLATDLLAEAGFGHYEISNFARPTRQCRHNLNYWLSGEYLGLGAGACSYLSGKRWTNNPDIREYISALENGGSPVTEMEEITDPIAVREWLMLRLRMLSGLEDGDFRQRFGRSLAEIFGPRIKRLAEQNLVLWDGQRLKINPEKLFISNEVLVAFQ